MNTTQDRECRIVEVVGRQGIGKSHMMEEFIKYYKQKHNRKALVFNVNGEDTYDAFKTIEIDPGERNTMQGHGIYIKKGDKQKDIYNKKRQYRRRQLSIMRGSSPRTVLPKHRSGQEMTNQETKDLLKDILASYRGGLLVIEDVDKYAARAQDQDIIGSWFTTRHKDRDVRIVHQSISMVSRYEWRGCGFMVLFDTADSVESSLNIPVEKREICQLAEMIVKEQVKAGNIRYHIYIYFDEGKIVGCSKETFVRNAKAYLRRYYDRKVKPYLKEKDEQGNNIYNESTAWDKGMGDLMKHFN